MNNPNSKKNHTVILAVVLVVLLIFAYKVLFMKDSESAFDQKNVAGEKAAAILRQMESIDFNTDVVQDSKFQTLQSLKIPLPNLPIGKKNPFSASAN